MADEFDIAAAGERYQRIMTQVKDIRYALGKNFVEYYTLVPHSRDEESQQHSTMKADLLKVSAKLNELINGQSINW